MGGIPTKCPNCGKTKAWKEEVNVFKSGISIGCLGRVRFGLKGPLARLIGKRMSRYKVTYRCHSCGFRKEYETEDA